MHLKVIKGVLFKGKSVLVSTHVILGLNILNMLFEDFKIPSHEWWFMCGYRIGVCVVICVCVAQRLTLGVLLVPHLIFLWHGFSLDPARRRWQQVLGTLLSLPSAPQHWGDRHALSQVAFTCGCLESNSGPHACMASTCRLSPRHLLRAPHLCVYTGSHGEQGKICAAWRKPRRKTASGSSDSVQTVWEKPGWGMKDLRLESEGGVGEIGEGVLSSRRKDRAHEETVFQPGNSEQGGLKWELVYFLGLRESERPVARGWGSRWERKTPLHRDSGELPVQRDKVLLHHKYFIMAPYWSCN